MNEYIALEKLLSPIQIDGYEFDLQLPKHCTGIYFCFKNKEAGKKFWKRKTMQFIRINNTQTHDVSFDCKINIDFNNLKS